jgi:ATP-dependent Clp protease ATP-binding subunit ClpA
LGREDVIAKVYDNLINHHKNYLLSLTGDGGVGKTSLAYKVADEIRKAIDNNQNTQLDGVIWISAKIRDYILMNGRSFS